MRTTIGCLLLALCLAVPVHASGEPRSPTARARVKQPRQDKAKKTKAAAPQRMTFDDDIVNAGRADGGGTMIKGRVAPKHSQLIPIRTDFVPELIKSAEDL
jgi:hypothetical protein